MMRCLTVALALVVLGLSGMPAKAAAPIRYELTAEEKKLPDQFQAWLLDVLYIISPEERAAFIKLEKDYQREAFIETFWSVRDPYPATARNEFRDRYQNMLSEARSRYGSLDDDRARMLLLNGLPAGSVEVRCTNVLHPVEVWFYKGSERTGEEFFVIFYRRFGLSRWVLYDPTFGLRELFINAGPTTPDQYLYAAIRDGCFDPDPLLAALQSASSYGFGGYGRLIDKLTQPPETPTGEWLSTYRAYSTEVPEGAQSFTAEVTTSFPARRQSRTVTQIVVGVPREALGVATIGESTSYNLVVNGEVLLDGKLFDRFRYRFDLPTTDVEGDRVAVALQRFLRPGSYRLIVRLEDLNQDQYYRLDRALEVPVLEADASVLPDADTAALLDEANRALADWDTSINILEPQGRDMQVGKVRFDTLVTGDRVAAVAFALEGKEILRKRTPPFSVELDLGQLPATQVLRATAYDADGAELVHDEILINTSAHRFAVRLAEPRPGKRYDRSLLAVAALEIPEGQRIDRVELFLDEDRVATLYQPPWEQPITLPRSEQLATVRAVAYLDDGNSTDDLVFVNAPPGLEEIRVDVVEMFLSIVDRQGRPVEGVSADQVSVREDGVTQELTRFEKVKDLPFHAVVLLDTSASMEDNIDATRAAAQSFLEGTITPKDRAAIITFNDRPTIAAKMTNDLRQLGGALAGLKAERGTALHDALIYSLFYLNGIKGQRALLLLSDGKDEVSRFTVDQAAEFARRSGVTIYAVGLGIPRLEGTRKLLKSIAEDTGGTAHFIEGIAELEPIWEAIESELRSQYFATYQSSNTSKDKKFREIEVSTPGGLTARTIRGYYP